MSSWDDDRVRVGVRERQAERERRARWSVGGILCCVVILGIVTMIAVAGGCVPAEAIRQAEVEAAICHGHASDAAIHPEARAIGASEERAWRAQYRALVGEDVPQAAREGWAPLEGDR